MINFAKRLFLVSFFFFSFSALAQLSPADFARAPEYHDVKLSPDGKHIAVVLTQEGKRKLAVFESESFKMVGATAFSDTGEVGDIHWVNNERIVIEILQKRGWREQLENNGELYAVDYDGGRGELIYGYRAGGMSTGTNIKQRKGIKGWAQIIDYLPDDEENILISSTKWSESETKLATVHKLNVYNGRLSSTIAGSTISDPVFLADQQGNLRLVYGKNEKYQRVAQKFDAENDKWIEIPQSEFGNDFQPLGFSKSGKWLYVFDNLNNDKTGLHKISMTTGERKELYTDPDVSITQAVFNGEGNVVYGLRVDPDYPTYIIFSSATEEAKTFKHLIQKFPGNSVTITSQSKDGVWSVVFLGADANPGTYYLYNKQNDSFKKLFDQIKLDTSQLSSAEPVKFQSRDGVTINGYLNRPVGAKPEDKLPLVTLVHGGPQSRDYWAFDREVQMLANQGYAVLRINFRGSSGYGNKFWSAGHKHWGDTIMHDVIDGTKWALANKNLDAGKVCVMGTSFGGYAAVQSATMEPDLFKCVVATAGVYDLEYMNKESIVLDTSWGESFLKMALGEDIEKMRAFSPVNNVNKLKAAILIAHGGKDEIVPIEHAEKLADKLKELNKPYKWFTKDLEGHGFFKEENRAEYYEEVARFMKPYLQ
ncbi:S9 family peptidase [Paraneptunicella aestuarii]|uniref:alpha/beta hydrolase family protein n=1 Tax=Paraneptunicella aestuarii TaxID=2831148 RepID=UPI001E329F78|nr:S9 family peptidase [Paraneptunicella aestuarii]UAA39240.1 S9 family peptidase [Paraneptunicella aestuarii]